MIKDLEVKNGGKTLIVFVWHEYDRNVAHFIRCLYPDDSVDYCFVENDKGRALGGEVTIKKDIMVGKSKLIWIVRPNVANDWGAFSQAVRSTTVEKYDYFVFINSSMRGPYLPSWYKSDQHWCKIFTSRLNDDVALVGSTINYCKGKPHVQSMMMCMDHRGLAILREEDIFMAEDRHIPKDDLIDYYEIGTSTAIIDAGYNIDCLLSPYQNRDWRKENQSFFPKVPDNFDHWGESQYFGSTVHPFDTIFIKTNRPYQTGSTPMNLESAWAEYGPYMDDTGKVRSKIDDPLEDLDDKSYEYVSDEETLKRDLDDTTSIGMVVLITISIILFVVAMVFIALYISSKSSNRRRVKNKH